MIGRIDASGRALLDVRSRRPVSHVETDVAVWIDTGFTGELVMPRPLIESLGLPLGPIVRAVLANGSSVELESFHCFLEWFGQWRSIEVVASAGEFPLLGVGLLMKQTLTVDYRAMILNLV